MTSAKDNGVLHFLFKFKESGLHRFFQEGEKPGNHEFVILQVFPVHDHGNPHDSFQGHGCFRKGLDLLGQDGGGTTSELSVSRGLLCGLRSIRKYLLHAFRVQCRRDEIKGEYAS